MAASALGLGLVLPVVVFATMAQAATTPLRPLRTAVLDPDAYSGPDAALAFARTEQAGATAVRIAVSWAAIAPAVPLPDFRPADPRDPAYRWAALDGQLQLAAAHGLTAIASIQTAPAWAFRPFRGFLRPDAAAYAAFAQAAARRYGGAVPGLPRVRVWQAWNEPNKVASPALKESAPDWYRGLTNAFAAAVHRVHSDNEVVAGGLSPFGITTAMAPLAFMRRVLCISNSQRPRPTCRTRVHFEIWSAHPYTAGGPNHHAYSPDDVSLGDLPEMRRVLDAADRAGQIIAARRPKFWVTEFGWDTNPPDPGALPAALQARWVAEALYRMWSAGVSLVTWFLLRDYPLADNPYQSGLYFRGTSFTDSRPKPGLAAFRFPFVALPEDGHILVWGRTPRGKPATVIVEQRVAGGWLRRTTLAANGYGIFSAAIAARGSAALRARLADGSASSPAFEPRNTLDRIYQPFGS